MLDIKPLLVDTGKGLSIKYKNRFIYSKYDPINNSKKLANNLKLENNTVYLIPSPILCYGINEIRNKLPYSSKLIFIEIDEFLYKISENKEFIINIKSGLDFLKIISDLDLSEIRKCQLLPINGAYEIFKNIYDNLIKILTNFIHNYWKNKYTLTKMGQLWSKNLLKNTQYINDSKPINNLRTNKPIVIIGAGESVESSLTLLKTYRESIFILCVDTALQILLEVDLKPDAVIALEAQFYNLPDFFGAKNLEIDLIFDLSSYPGVLRNLKGNKYYTLTKFSDSSLIQKVQKEYNIESLMPPLGSVGITAIYIALKITNNNVYLSGLDFSYTLGKTHSRGTPYHLSTLINWNRITSGDSYIQCLKRPLINKLNKSGIIENTDSILFEYSKITQELLSGNNRVYDLTTKGMDLGIKKATFKDIKEFYPQKEICNNKLNITNKIQTKHINNFYINEKNKLKNSIKLIQKYKNNKECFNNIKSSLIEIDYLFDHYPENKPINILNENNINRFYLTLLRFSRIL